MHHPGSSHRSLEATKLQVGEALFFICPTLVRCPKLLPLLPARARSAVDHSDHVYIPKHPVNH